MLDAVRFSIVFTVITIVIPLGLSIAWILYNNNKYWNKGDKNDD